MLQKSINFTEHATIQHQDDDAKMPEISKTNNLGIIYKDMLSGNTSGKGSRANSNSRISPYFSKISQLCYVPSKKTVSNPKQASIKFNFSKIPQKSILKSLRESHNSNEDLFREKTMSKGLVFKIQMAANRFLDRSTNLTVGGDNL